MAAAPEATTPSPASPLVAIAQQTQSDAGRGDATRGNRVAIINGGYDALLLRVHLIRSARRSIAIQTFIWTNDECGRLLMCELIEAARRGVKVRIVADQIASDKDPDTVAFLATVHPNLQIRHYRPIAGQIRPSKLQTALSGLVSLKETNQRMHNKVMLFDDEILITGGRNIENTYYDHSTEMNFRDRDALAVGPVAREAARSFDEYWNYRHCVPSTELADVAAAIWNNKFKRFATRADYDFGGFFGALDREASDPQEIERRFVARLRPAEKVSFLADKPGKNRSLHFWGQGRITRQLKNAILEAQECVIMQSPYLVLSGKAAELFAYLKKRTPGLRIAIVSNSFASTDNLLAYSANYRLRARYIEDLGLEVHEFKPLPAELLTVFPGYPELKERAAKRVEQGAQARLPFLCIHAKSLVVDNRLGFIGSYNLDPRSENLNTEAGLLIEDPAVCAELKATILGDAAAENSWVIAKRQVPLHLDKLNRLVDGILGLSPIDVWPLQNSTSFELVPGMAEVPASSPDFYRSYREAGDFPGAERGLTTKEILTRLYKAVGPVLAPMI